jgi:hypothetical protein
MKFCHPFSMSRCASFKRFLCPATLSMTVSFDSRNRQQSLLPRAAYSLNEGSIKPDERFYIAPTQDVSMRFVKELDSFKWNSKLFQFHDSGTSILRTILQFKLHLIFFNRIVYLNPKKCNFLTNFKFETIVSSVKN